MASRLTTATNNNSVVSAQYFRGAKCCCQRYMYVRGQPGVKYGPTPVLLIFKCLKKKKSKNNILGHTKMT